MPNDPTPTDADREFHVGDKIRYTFPREPCLRDLPDSRLTSEGVLVGIYLRLDEIKYRVKLKTPVLGEYFASFSNTGLMTHDG